MCWHFSKLITAMMNNILLSLVKYVVHYRSKGIHVLDMNRVTRLSILRLHSGNIRDVYPPKQGSLIDHMAPCINY